jgi:guanylate kinase
MKSSSGRLFVLSGPAGTGKTTLVAMLTKEHANIVKSVSYTTRPKRLGEVEGLDYFFVDQRQFFRAIEQGEFLEFEKVFDYYYGTPRRFVEEQLSAGFHVILVIDTQGALRLKREHIEATFIFLHPPSREEQKRRLERRSTESSAAIEQRVSRGGEELLAAQEYDYQIINDCLSTTYRTVRDIILLKNR